MAIPERVVILAAGKSLQLDGINKVLIRHPDDGRTILDYMIDAFDGKEITVVVGFNAIQIMQEYPQLNYVVNPNWALTNNAMSLGLALNDKASYIVPGDIFITKSLIERLDEEVPDIALTRMTENRVASSIHCIVDESGFVTEIYQGSVHSSAHPETTGIFKVSDASALRAWRKQCSLHANLFAGQLLPHTSIPIKSVDIQGDQIWEINTPVDYLNLIYHCKER